MKWIKRSLIALGLLVILLVGLVTVFALSFDPNAYRDEITGAVQQQTGRELVLEGDIGLTLFPYLGAELGRARLSNAEGFGTGPFAEVAKVQLRVAVLPLLRRELRVGGVLLDGLVLNLARDADGRTNWDDLTEAQAAGGSEPAPEPAPEAEPPAESGSPPALYIAGVELRDAVIRYRDDQAGQAIEVAPLNLTTGGIALGGETPVALDLRLRQESPLLEAALDLEAVLAADLPAQRYTVSDLRLDVEANGEGLPPAGVDARLVADVVADLAAGVADITGLTLESAGVQLGGALKATGLQDEPRISGRLSTTTFDPRAVAELLEIALPPTADPEALRSVSLSMAVNADAEAAQLGELDLRLDETRLQGSARLANYAAPALEFDLTADQLDLDRYLPPATEDGGEADDGSSGEPGAAGPFGLPVELLRRLDVDGRLQVGAFTVKRVRMSDIAMTLRAEDGLVQLEPFSLGLYGGLLDGGLALDVRRDTPAVSLTQNVSGLEVGDLLADLLGDRYLSGQTALSLSLSTQGDDWKRLLRALDGSLKLGIDNGSLRESEFVRGLAQAVGFFKPEAATQAESLSFQSLAGTASIDGGILSSDNLAFASESLSGSGDGRIDLAAQAIDYTLSLTEAGGDPRKSVPLRITGALTDPSVKLDLEAALKREAERAVQEQQERLERKVDEKVEELEQKAGEELEQKLRDALPGFLR